MGCSPHIKLNESPERDMGRRPHGGARMRRGILSDMKFKPKLELTFAGLITAAYPAWLARRSRRPVRNADVAPAAAGRVFYFFRERMAAVDKTKALVDRIKIGLAIAVLMALTGCVAWVGGGYGGGGWWGDDGGWWGGGRGDDRGRDVHGYSERGAASRAAAHGEGGGHGSGGGGGGRR